MFPGALPGEPGDRDFWAERQRGGIAGNFGEPRWRAEEMCGNPVDSGIFRRWGVMGMRWAFV